MISEKFKKMAQKIYINPDEKVVESIANEYQFIQNNLEILKTINVDNVEPFTRISPPINFENLRADETQTKTYLAKEVVLENAKEKDQDFVIIKRII